jgi:hypothetical protein
MERWDDFERHAAEALGRGTKRWARIRGRPPPGLEHATALAARAVRGDAARRRVA